MLALDGFKGPVRRMAFSPAEPLLALVAGREQKARLFRLPEQTRAESLPISKSGPTDVAFSPDGRLLITIDGEADLVWHDLAENLRHTRPSRASTVRDLVRPRLVTLPQAAVDKLPDPPIDDATVVVFHYSTSDRYPARRMFINWLVELELPRMRMRMRNTTPYPGMGGEVLSAHPSEPKLLVGRDWKCLSLATLGSRTEPASLFSEEEIRDAVLSGDGSHIIAATFSGVLTAPASAPESLTPLLPLADVTGLAACPGRSTIAAVSANGTVCVFDATTGAEALRLNAGIGPLHAATFSADGSLLAVGGVDQAAVFDM